MNKKNYIAVLFFLAAAQVISSCSSSSAERRMQKMAEMHAQKRINNGQLLFEMGKIFLENLENPSVENEYFHRLMVSGYSSHVLHHYLQKPDKIRGADDMETILSALQKGKHYNLARKFYVKTEGDFLLQLKKLEETWDSIMFYNQKIKENPRADFYVRRGIIYTKLDEQDLANRDLDDAMRLDSCNFDAVFQKTLMHFDQENTQEIIALLDNCEKRINHANMVWMPMFYQLAKNIEGVEKSNKTKEEKLFESAHLYINNGFPEIAHRKSQELLKTHNNNADYLALQAFIYYRMGRKAQALECITEVEEMTGKNSKLKELIAAMN